MKLTILFNLLFLLGLNQVMFSEPDCDLQTYKVTLTNNSSQRWVSDTTFRESNSTGCFEGKTSFYFYKNTSTGDVELCENKIWITKNTFRWEIVKDSEGNCILKLDNEELHINFLLINSNMILQLWKKNEDNSIIVKEFYRD
ncbi:MAG TPA: hypothetical protein PK605_15015 [Ignavibacteria bacterium]|nr:hypothetical protein [Bacteroidota bacterium]HRE10000.1 hypothetical protein [Ignavibacteria bacterium]HRF66933.1 hypothetical protein [Ignavibacteria bacterium]HRJ05712.1 hypothetical protein [Ignavibacteria bacterium]HRJ85499.1 hypothetical protein [Ignavibacteria bacterium]